jgi:predicted nucleic acid-binding protein
VAALDASVLVAYLAGGELAEQARRALLVERRATWAPHLIDAEVGHALRRTVLVGEPSAARAGAALTPSASSFP